MGFPRQDYCSELPFLSPGDLPNPGIKPGSPALQAVSLPTEPPGKPKRASLFSVKVAREWEVLVSGPHLQFIFSENSTWKWKTISLVWLKLLTLIVLRSNCYHQVCFIFSGIPFKINVVQRIPLSALPGVCAIVLFCLVFAFRRGRVGNGHVSDSLKWTPFSWGLTSQALSPTITHKEFHPCWCIAQPYPGVKSENR